MSRYLTRLTATLMIFIASGVQATGILITPGQWQFQISASTPLMAKPINKTLTECLTNKEISPRALMKNAPGCQLSDVQSNGKQLNWKMTCDSHGGKMNGTGSFSSSGDVVNGTMDMVMNMHGQALTMHNRWSGKRIGACH
ncbi:DUF3617 domain-containing protein [Sedimenticola sp.]|uniref:DUF3617 domain-containing protein n=1 Tax=Sedimenticola sp. TaxID=1940285 RepID=UPI003D0FD5D7